MTIAHRLNTIIGYDMVMVLDKGMLMEVGSPRELLESGGLFAGMATAAGLRR